MLRSLKDLEGYVIRATVGEVARMQLGGKIDCIGLSTTNFIAHDSNEKQQPSRQMTAVDHRTALVFLLNRFEVQPVFAFVGAVGHRVVHGMKHSQPERVTLQLICSTLPLSAWC